MYPISIASDGGHLAYTKATVPSGLEAWILPLDITHPDEPKAGRPELFLRAATGARDPAFSPDGHWIACALSESSRDQIHVVPFPGPGGRFPIASVGGEALRPRWSRSAHQLLFATSDGSIMVSDYQVRGDSFIAEKPRRWTETRLSTNIGLPNFDISPDGRRVLSEVSPADTEQRNASVHITLLLNFYDELKRRLP